MTALALFSWPLIAIVMFRVMGRMKGLIWNTLIGALFLPEAVAYDLPGLPPYDKPTAIMVGMLLGLALSREEKAPMPPTAAVPNRLITGFCALYLVSAVFTVATNGETLVFGPRVLPGLGFRDLMSMTVHSLSIIVPVLVARRHLAEPEAQVALMQAFVFAGLGYSLLVLFEARMSPQLHTWIYGYFPHSWLQHVRDGAFRPVVFQPHGLFIGILLAKCAILSFILLKMRTNDGGPRLQYIFAGVWFILVLLLSRNLGATMLVFLFVPLAWFFGPRIQLLVASSVVIFMLTFPLLRQTNAISFDPLLNFVGTISEDRRSSFQFRLDNEDLYMERAAKKPISGWGLWGRWRVFDERTGRDVSVADGLWIILLGERGWLGFIGYFGLVTAPILLLWRTAMSPTAVGLGLLMSPVLLYQIPNATIGPLTLMIVGALAGYVQRMPQRTDTEEDAEEDGIELATARRPARPGYTRFPDGAPAVRERIPRHARPS